MVSNRTQPKSLKDTLLEYTVLNIDFVFPRQFNDNASVPIFPDCLFEEILWKSKDMCWKIEKEHLKPCIAVRDRLKWSEASYLRFVDDFSATDLLEFIFSIGTLDTIKVTVCLEKPWDVAVFNLISKAANTLIDLDLTITLSDSFRKYITLFNTQYLPEVKALIGECKPLKLKRLRLDAPSFMLFPFTLDHDELTTLELCNCRLTETFIKTLVDFKNLIRLSLSQLSLVNFKTKELVSAVTSLKSLRQLAFGATVDVHLLNGIMRGLENLDVLELKNVSLDDPNLLLAHGRKLSVLNFRHLKCPVANYTAAYSALRALALKMGTYSNIGLMGIISSTPSRFLYHIAVKNLFKKIEVHQGVLTYYNIALAKLEKDGYINFRSPLSFHRSLPYGRTSYDVAQRIVCYGMSDSELRIYPFIKKWIENFVKHNKNTHLARRFSR